ncbi:unnamed protein product [Strongylus vulgaris]|uniref:Uncharacterized protein n=1 Tax=Strongylus vulgaris TaxID=40348 RepID=A0A3P7IKV7_STRVU|nr:unnamed protein product [Strongylus vulgaris]
MFVVQLQEYLAEHPPTPTPAEEAATKRRGGVRLKRPLEDESPLKQRPSKAISEFSSLFDTPEKGKCAVWGELSPQKALKSPATSGTPIRSPRKPLIHKEVLLKNVECLLLPTPEKRSRVEELKPFEPEEGPSKKNLAGVAKKDVAAAFDPVSGKVIKRAFKRSAPSAGLKKKKVEGNFVRINMKKKSYSRGKVSAEQKRKMRRKQNWKKRFGGGRA